MFHFPLYILLRFVFGVVQFIPYKILYLLSDGLFWVLYRAVKYRVKIVDKNLLGAFPQYDEKKRESIKVDFYKYFCDMLLETIKCMTQSESTIKNRLTIKGGALFQTYFEQQKNVVVVLAHYGNFEMLCRVLPHYSSPYETYCTYQPIKNQTLDAFIKSNREKYGTKMISVKDVKQLYSIQKSGKPCATWFVMDQVPGAPHQSAHWMTFLNQDTPVIYGPEKYAAKFNQAVVYCNVDKVRRGHYEIVFSSITDDASKEAEHFVTETEMKRLEGIIQKKPSTWLWTHNRWKHKRIKHEG